MPAVPTQTLADIASSRAVASAWKDSLAAAGGDDRNATPGRQSLNAAYAQGDRVSPGARSAGSRERIMRSLVVFYSSRPALACIIGARRAWTVEMISSEEIPCR